MTAKLWPTVTINCRLLTTPMTEQPVDGTDPQVRHICRIVEHAQGTIELAMRLEIKERHW